MNHEPTAAANDQKASPKPARWVRITRRLLLIVIVLNTLVALLYAEENWRGARAWANCKKWLESRGESLDRASVIPLAIPDEQNFALTPLLRAMVAAKDAQMSSPDRKTSAPASVRLVDITEGIHPVPMHRANRDEFYSLEEYQKFFRGNPETYPLPTAPQSAAKDVLDAVNKFAPELDELERAAAERPLARWPVNYDAQPLSIIEFGRYDVIQSCVRVLMLRARAALALGDTGRAKSDLLLGFRLNDISAKEPFLISELTRTTTANILVRVMKEGMATRQWSADDLVAFSRALEKMDLLKDFQLAVRGERLLFVNPGLNNSGTNLTRGFTEGWINQGKVTFNTYVQTYVLDAIDLKTRRIDIDRVQAGQKFLQELPWSPMNFVVLPVGSTVGSLSWRVAGAQASIDQARVACALEKYYLDKGAYPSVAAELVPAYLDRLPTGVIDGQPIGYERTGDGRYRLWFTPPPNEWAKRASEWEWKYDGNAKK